MDIHEVPITGPRFNIGADGRCGVSRVQIARTIAQHYGWVERDGQVCRRSELGGDVIAKSDAELGDALRALGWISDTGYPVWSVLPGLETRAADQVSHHLAWVGLDLVKASVTTRTPDPQAKTGSPQPETEFDQPVPRLHTWEDPSMATSTTLDPAVTLATSMHAQPGMYALLLGSGVSRAAEIPTGWQIVSDLVTRVAALTSPDDVDAARADPETWWRDHYDGELGYSTLLEQLAPTPAGRQALIDQFFDRSDDEEDEHVKRPTAAHRAIAQLIKRGAVQVVITTNFDRLLEDALAEVGVTATVLARPEAVAGMAPLVRGGVTIVKVHGDRKDVTTLNTEGELATYSPKWEALLAQIFDEYGLVVAGWSADWDPALARAVERAPNRRYPLYWDSRSSQGGTAQHLLTARAGQIIQAPDADTLFTTLRDNLEALDQLAQPPLTTEMAVARLKRYLPDPVRRIDLHDLVMDEVDAVVETIADQPVVSNDVGQLGTNLDAYTSAAGTLLRLLAVGTWHDDGTYNDLWVETLQRLIDAGTASVSSAMSELEHARRYPALLAALTMGLTSTARGREGLFVRLLTAPHGRDMGRGTECPAVVLLDYDLVLESQMLNSALEGRWRYPASHLVQTVLEPVTRGFIPRGRFQQAFYGVEYRWGLIGASLPNGYPLAGEHIGETASLAASRGDDGMVYQSEVEFRRSRDLDPWMAKLAELEDHAVDLDSHLIAHRARLKEVRAWARR